MMFKHLSLAALSLVLCLPAARAADQAAILNQLYGRGVHAYFSGELLEALQSLTAAIQAGSQDPRVYYFRGLTYLKMGRTAEAEADMAAGGRLEMGDVDQVYAVSRSLERVQGSNRLTLEQYRRQAETEAYEREQRRRKQRYEALRRREQDVLRRQVEIPLDEFAPKAESGSPPVAPPAKAPAEPSHEAAPLPPPVEKPLAVPQSSTAAPQRELPPPAAPPVQTVPDAQKMEARSLAKFLTRMLNKALPEEKPAPTTPPAQVNPFADTPQPPAAGQAPPPPPAAANPFAQPAPASPQDPFAEPPAEKPPQPADSPPQPTETPPQTPADLDPFAPPASPPKQDQPPAKQGQPPAKEPPPEPAENDPFGGGT